MTWKGLVALNGRMPLSVAETEMRFVLRACSLSGTQVNTPVNLLTLAPLGALTTPKVNWLVGRSGSVTTLVTRKGRRTWARELLSGWNTGALLVFWTRTVKLWVALKLGAPLSLTITLMAKVAGVGTSGGVQV